MRTRHLISVAALSLTVFLPASLALAQMSQTPVPEALITSQGIQVDKPILELSNFDQPLSFRLEDKGGVLFLIDTPVTRSGARKADDKVLWSGKPEETGCKFTLEMAEAEEDLKDENGRVLWSYYYEEPSLILDRSYQNYIRLLNTSGRELARLPEDPASQSIPAFSSRTNNGATSTPDDVCLVTDSGRQQTSVYVGKRLLWSGHRPPNDGLRLGYAPGGHTLGILTAKFPAGTVINLTVMLKTGSVKIVDAKQNLIKIAPVDILSVQAFSTDEKAAQCIQIWTGSHMNTAVGEVHPTTTGTIYADFHAAEGDWTGDSIIHANAEIWHIPGQLKQKYVEEQRVDLDQSGEEIGLKSYGFRIMP